MCICAFYVIIVSFINIFHLFFCFFLQWERYFFLWCAIHILHIGNILSLVLAWCLIIRFLLRAYVWIFLDLVSFLCNDTKAKKEHIKYQKMIQITFENLKINISHLLIPIQIVIYSPQIAVCFCKL